MRNRFFFLLGLVILMTIIWMATVMGIEKNRKDNSNDKIVISFCINKSKKYNLKKDFYYKDFYNLDLIKFCNDK